MSLVCCSIMVVKSYLTDHLRSDFWHIHTFKVWFQCHVCSLSIVRICSVGNKTRWLVWERAGSQYVNASLKSHEYWKEEAAR
ncbi:hypothetical protein SDJN03_23607, partial [Cucurbita argyrosperma subsp. sororia]